MKATEARDRLDEIINEFGDCELYLRDQLEPMWRAKVGDVEFEPDREAILISAEDY